MDFDFTIVVRGDCTQPAVADRLFSAFDEDPGVSSTGQLSYIDLTVRADTFGEAIVRALRQFLDAGTGLSAVDILTDTAMTLEGMAEFLPFGYERLRQLQRGVQGPGGFPRPVVSNGHRIQVWNWGDVRAWLLAHNLADRAELDDLASAPDSLETLRAALRLTDPAAAAAAHPEVRSFLSSYMGYGTTAFA